MRILLDESLPRRFAGLLAGHALNTVARVGWAGKKNGELLQLAATRFDVFMTADQNLQYQQNLAALPIAVIVLKVFQNDLQYLQPLAPQILAALAEIQPRTLIRIEST